jgi:hypothetical protein
VLPPHHAPQITAQVVLEVADPGCYHGLNVATCSYMYKIQSARRVRDAAPRSRSRGSPRVVCRG